MQTHPRFGRERVRQQVVVMPHQDSLDGADRGQGSIAAYFSSPPFTQIALKDPKVRAVASSVDIMGGKTSFLVMASPKSVLAAHPKLPEVLAKAIDEASGIIRNDPRRAAMIWLKWEPSHTLDARAVSRAILRDLKDDFGSGDIRRRSDCDLSAPRQPSQGGVSNWKDVVAPALAAGQGS